jgi:Arc/MetJ-type ribon-helix-helix transcriptional regulator
MTKEWATKWKTVQIPEEYYNQIQDYVKTGRSGYTSVSEYVRNAIRAKLKEGVGIERR